MFTRQDGGFNPPISASGLCPKPIKSTLLTTK